MPGTLTADQARELFEPRKQIALYQAYLLQQRMLDVSEAHTHTSSLSHTPHTHTPQAHTLTHAPHTNTPHTHMPHTHASSHASRTHTARTHTPGTHISHTHAAHTHTSHAHSLGLAEGARRIVPMEGRVMHFAPSAHSHDHYHTATHYNTLQHTATHCNTRDASRAVAAHSHEQTQQSEQPPNAATFVVSADPPRMQLRHQLERRRQSCMPQVLVCESCHSCKYVMSRVCTCVCVCVCVCVCMYESHRKMHHRNAHEYRVATISKLLLITGLFCKRAL